MAEAEGAASSNFKASKSRKRIATVDPLEKGSLTFPPRKRPAIEAGGEQSALTWRVERVQQYIAKRSVSVGLPLPTRMDGFPNRNTTTTHIQFGESTIPLTLTDSGRVAEDWVCQQTGKGDGDVIVGFDIEWRPNFAKGAPDNRTALLQLCTEKGCLILQMLFLDFVPRALVEFLREPRVKLVGVGVQNDAAKLRRDHGLNCGGEVELGPLAAARLGREEVKQVGLKALAMAILGLEISKPKKVTTSNWAARRLQPRQIEYACIDAFVSFAIGYQSYTLSSSRNSTPD